MTNSGHDKLVEEVARAVATLGEVNSDLPGGRPFTLPKPSDLVLSAFVPTRAVFANFAVMSASDLAWKVPDVVVSRNDRRVVVDVCGWRESSARSARKVENAIASSQAGNIVGVVLVYERPAKKGFTKSSRRDEELDRAMDRLQRSLSVVLRGAPVNAASPCEALQGIWKALDPAVVGEVRWSAIREVDASQDSWANELVSIVSALLGSDEPLLTGRVQRT